MFGPLLISAALPLGALQPPRLVETGTVPFRGVVKGNDNLSGAAVVGDYLVVGSDETSLVQVLKKDGDGYKVVGDVPLGPDGVEIDIEGVAADGNTVYVVGSHSRVRKKPKDDAPGKLDDQPARYAVFRFTLKADGTVDPNTIKRKSLRGELKDDPVLAPFLDVASKENGIDIEGLAVKDGRLAFGFRGPVLRDNLVPVVTGTFDDLSGTYKVRYVRLGGRGVRDLTAVAGGYLILGGPVGDGDQDYRVYFWDGAGEARPLGVVPPRGDGKPEALTVLADGPTAWDVLILCDGLTNGEPTRYAVPKPIAK